MTSTDNSVQTDTIRAAISDLAPCTLHLRFKINLPHIQKYLLNLGGI